MVHVRYGKAKRGQPPRRRNVASVMGWAVEAVADYVENIRPKFGCEGHPALWVTERGEGSGRRRSTPGSRPTGTLWACLWQTNPPEPGRARPGPAQAAAGLHATRPALPTSASRRQTSAKAQLRAGTSLG